MSKKYPLIGAHISIAGGYYKSIERAESIGCSTMQIFTKSNRTWFGKKITDEEANKFKETLKRSNLSEIMVHSAYLINLAAQNTELRNKSVEALGEELERCQKLGIKYLVLHPGAHVGAGEEEGIKKISEGLDQVFKKIPGPTQILLETAAGQGTNLGYTFEQLEQIYKQCKNKQRLGICLDTCHVFAAGYDISTEKGYKNTIKEFIKIIGIHKLKAIHLNDSKTKLNARIDRHEKLGKGNIPLKTFEWIMKDQKFKEIPKILETPIIKDALKEYEIELKLLNKLSKNK
ncbi:deoxyribonuclease IV [Candidatus Babeliales bacterium]|nr:deoxyribonuclease IV [Candidatus Babeliales bacterium]